MVAFILNRCIKAFFVLVIVSFMAFMLMYLIPGDPVAAVLGIDARPAEIAKLRAELGLDNPVMVRYYNWLSDAVRGDFGHSVVMNEDVMVLIRQRLEVTTYIGAWAFFLTVVIGIPLGVICAMRRGGFLDSLISAFANIGISIPIFLLCILLIYFFGLYLGWLPIQGFTSPMENFWLSVKKIIMPIACLTVLPLAMIVRQTRSSMLEVVGQDYIRTAWAKGLRELMVIRRHAVKNALIPIATMAGMLVLQVVGGSVLVETVFNLPGMGRLLVESVFNRDFIVVQAVILVIATFVMLVNLIVDISYGWLDPRIHYD